ncbi:MAG TPA: response regulator, partial [Anaerolineales bacterium]|nr:response regulator [Anaerolineales bacterium]
GSIAIKAFKQTGPDGKPEIMLQITDTGPGIALEHQAKLFQPFSQVDASLTRKTGGTGLGLSICRHLVELHGGRIGLESEVGIGSTFFFTIPVQLPATGSLTAPDARLVLVIDDERPIVQLYERYLNRHGYRVIGLSEPQDALRRAREVMPYAILLDVMMPGRDGWHVLEDLKSDPDTCSIPVIMCTILESQAKGQSLGADGYLTKPILEEELVHTLSNLEVKAYKYNILGITDNDREFERFQAVFKDEPDYQLGLAFGGHQAISSMQFRRPDAILLAIEPLKTKSTHPLSGLSVISLLETIRNDPLLQDIPVILFAELPLDARHGARIQELATAVIPKNDWAKETVMEKIQQLLNQKNPAS